MKNLKIIVIAAAVILLLSWFFFFKEYFFYKDIIKSQEIYSCEAYYSKYPSGRYTVDVKLLEIDLSQDFNKVRDFINDFPDDINNDKFLSLKEALWEKVKTTYEQKVGSEDYNREAVTFFKEALDYMEENNEFVIKVNLRKHLDLKDYEDYTEDARYYVELLYAYANGKDPSSSTISLTDNFSSGDIANLERIISTTLTETFTEVFGTDFFEVKSETDLFEELKNPLEINIDFDIKNQLMDIDEYEVTELWTYTQNDIFQAYVPAIMIDFDFRFKIPETNKAYNFSNSVDPASEVSGFGSLEEGYQMMTQTVFNNYSEKIINDFGLN